MNNITSPLKLTWKDQEWEYKVNKPHDQSGEYVDKQIAVNLLSALEKLVEQFDKIEPLYSIETEYINEAKMAIKQATTSC